MFTIRRADDRDSDFWLRMDRHISKEELLRKMESGQCRLIGDDRTPAGVLRYGLFWDNTPFLNMLLLAEAYRGKGYGKAALLHWEDEMRASGYGTLLTSTRSDESAQHFFRRMGYQDAGCLLLDTQPAELFLIKKLTPEL